jgi:anti-sigma regulatory factor (Ser/Thr protein kinase)
MNGSALQSGGELRIRVRDAADRERALKASRDFGFRLGFGERPVEEIALVVSELASNAVKYAAGEGSIALRALEGAGERGLEIAYDAPGNPPPRNGNGRPSLGIGLDVIRNHVDEFEFAGGGEEGVRLRARKFLPDGEPPMCLADVSAVTFPAEGQIVNGDGFFVDRTGRRVLIAVFDGLGHGPGAYEVAALLRKTFAGCPGWDIETLLHRSQKALEGTRGAAVAAWRLDLGDGTGIYAGIGNVETRWMGAGPKVSFVPVPGILGRPGQRIRTGPFRIEPPGTLVMVSDGVPQRALVPRPEDPEEADIARRAWRLVHEAGRSYDDKTAVVVRIRRNPARLG